MLNRESCCQVDASSSKHSSAVFGGVAEGIGTLRETTAIRECYAQECVYLVAGTYPSNVHLEGRSQGSPAEHCLVSLCFSSPGEGVRAAPSRPNFKEENLFFLWLNLGPVWDLPKKVTDLYSPAVLPRTGF